MLKETGERSRPVLRTESPLPDATYPLTRSPFVVGRGRDVGARIDHPLVDAQHVVLLERADGWWLAGTRSAVRVNGHGLSGQEQRLAHGDRIELATGATLRFDDGRPEPAARQVASRGNALPPRRRRRWRLPEWNLSGRTVLVSGMVLLAVALVGGFGWIAWRTIAERPQAPAPLLSEQDGLVFDSLFSVALDHIERGNILLDLGVSQTALNEFAEGITTLSTSTLRKNAYVQERIEELRTSISAVYLERRIAVPASLAGKRGGRALQGQGLASVLSVPDFGSAIDAVRAEFQARFKVPLDVTGRDHAEHLSLYGAGGAVDLRSRGLSPVQVQFVVESAQRIGVRVKDFSRDAILQAQIAAAINAGVADRASTGLHLHLDRFADRRDRWTVPR